VALIRWHDGYCKAVKKLKPQINGANMKPPAAPLSVLAPGLRVAHCGLEGCVLGDGEASGFERSSVFT
jgi:hypothetical protein